jgi:hypothetical protein
MFFSGVGRQPISASPVLFLANEGWITWLQFCIKARASTAHRLHLNPEGTQQAAHKVVHHSSLDDISEPGVAFFGLKVIMHNSGHSVAVACNKEPAIYNLQLRSSRCYRISEIDLELRKENLNDVKHNY